MTNADISFTGLALLHISTLSSPTSLLRGPNTLWRAPFNQMFDAQYCIRTITFQMLNWMIEANGMFAIHIPHKSYFLLLHSGGPV